MICIVIVLCDFCGCSVECVLGETLTGQMSMCGVLMVLAGMLKHGKRDDLIEFGKLLISSVFSCCGYMS